jgi:hypothetical protein
VGLIGKLLEKTVTGPQYKGHQRPWDKKFVAEITGIEEQGGGRAIVSVNYFTGDETPWQGPKHDDIKTVIPEGVEPRIGQRVVVGSGSAGNSLSNNPRPVFWDEPAPELPPMQFPNIPGGDDPKVMLGYLESQVESGGLPPDGLERARAYLENGDWPDPAGTRS